ncbi:hypothetical protein VMCG_07905 [Cytospora schulzeri]|uniref:Uncharacterized protein n=1 Tax=Cytospora schulzeri TaxID=448051 RepID=A0A423W085_9PEZI|nr:hypothetical protein VMCG_07905 [Valsa malicola]
MAPDQVQHAHAELIDALTELYTLLDILGALPPANSYSDSESPTINVNVNIFLPPHTAGSVNADAAGAAGFAPEAVSLMSALPFLAGDHTYKHGSGCELMPSTYALSYLGEDLDEGDFEWRRELLSDGLMPPTALKLTQSAVYGVEWIYDVGTGLLTPWKPFDHGLSDTNDYSHVTALPPRQVIGPLIDRYRRLDNLATPSGEVDFSSPLFAEAPLDPVTGEAQPPRDWGPVDATKWHAQYAVWRATRGIKDLYLECGWDVDAREQHGFRRDEFLRKRAVYWAEAVEPLVQAEAEL